MRIFLLLLVLLTSAALATQEEITVQFKPGTSGASYSGSVKASEAKSRGELHDSYTLGAAKGQVMTVDASATAPISIYVWRKSKGFNQGYMLNSKGENKLHVRFVLPANDDYVVNVEQGDLNQGIDYNIKFGIR